MAYGVSEVGGGTGYDKEGNQWFKFIDGSWTMDYDEWIKDCKNFKEE